MNDSKMVELNTSGPGLNPAKTSYRSVPALELRDVAKSYGDVDALRPTSLTVNEGELVTLLGPSGSGKSTLLSIVTGSVAPNSGSVLFRGEDVTGKKPADRGIGMVFQRYTLFPNRTVAENVAFPLEVRKVEKAVIKLKVGKYLKLVGLEAEASRFPSEISGGQAQRVALARALVFEPALILMDEPLGALDRALRHTLQDEIRRIQKQTQVPTLYVTHDQEEAMSLSDKIAVLKNGEIVDVGTPRDLYQFPASVWSAQFFGDANVCAVKSSVRMADNQFLATTEHGLTVSANSINSRLGDGCQLIIRPEDGRVVTDPERGASYPAGTVVDLTFLGSRQKISLALDCGWTVLVDAPVRELSITPGDRVWYIPPQAGATIVDG